MLYTSTDFFKKRILSLKKKKCEDMNTITIEIQKDIFEKYL